MQKLIGLGGNALIAISLLKKKNYVTTLGECNARITGASKVKTNYGNKTMNNEQNSSDAKVHPVDTLVTLSVQDAFETLKQAMQNDPDYAWGWHCNVAMSHYDAMSAAGYTDHDARHKTANNGAARFMKLCFDIDTSKHKNFTAM